MLSLDEVYLEISFFDPQFKIRMPCNFGYIIYATPRGFILLLVWYYFIYMIAWEDLLNDTSNTRTLRKLVRLTNRRCFKFASKLLYHLNHDLNSDVFIIRRKTCSSTIQNLAIVCNFCTELWGTDSLHLMNMNLKFLFLLIYTIHFANSIIVVFSFSKRGSLFLIFCMTFFQNTKLSAEHQTKCI